MDFFLGTHEVSWLARAEFADVPLFISHVRLRPRRSLPRAVGTWALDSGAFSELSLHGAWRSGPDEYADNVARYTDEIGGLAWAAPQDWMCEPWIVEKTGLSVLEHQQRTVDNFLALRGRGPFVPVLQGWEPADYLRHVALYETEDIDLRDEPLVGLGSVCRRNTTADIASLVFDLAAGGLRLHGFGVKRRGLPVVGPYLVSADSLAWSYGARRAGQQPGCSHKNCNSCSRFALRWRAETLRSFATEPPVLWGPS